MAVKKKKQREEAIQRILQATIALLGEGDPGSLSLAKIARRAGVSKSLLLYYFHSKEELILRAQHSFFENLLRTISRAYPQKDISHAFSAMDEVFRALRSLSPLFPLFVLFVRQHLKADPRQRSLLSRFFDELRDLTQEAIETFLGSQTLASLGIPLSSLREILFLIFLGLVLFTPITGKKEVDAEEVYETFKEILRSYVALRGNPFPPGSAPLSLPDKGLHPQI